MLSAVCKMGRLDHFDLIEVVSKVQNLRDPYHVVEKAKEFPTITLQASCLMKFQLLRDVVDNRCEFRLNVACINLPSSGRSPGPLLGRSCLEGPDRSH